MIMDQLAVLSDRQAVAATGGSTNVYDLGSARQVGAGRPLWVVFSIHGAAAAGGTYTFALQTDDAANFPSPAQLASRTVSAAELVDGKQFAMSIPAEGVERYLRAHYTLGGTDPAVTVTAHITDQEPRSWRAEPDAL